MAAARNEQFLVSGEHSHFVPLHLTLLKISTLNLADCSDCSHFQDNYYKGVMKEVLPGVGKLLRSHPELMSFQMEKPRHETGWKRIGFSLHTSSGHER